MITITNGSLKLKVTKEVFKCIYKPTGWQEEDSGSKNLSSIDEETTGKEISQLELMSMSVDDMSGPQLKQLAEELGITTQNKSKDNVKKEVKKALEQEV